MSPDTLTKKNRKHDPQNQPEIAIDTTGMSEGQAKALEVAEAARDNVEGRVGFAAGLFMGRCDADRLLPFPEQTEVDRQIGDEMVRRVCAFLTEHLDPDAVDETRTIPKKVMEGLRELGVFRMKVPDEYGGLGFSQVNYNRVLMAIASYCASTAVVVSAHQSIGVPQPLRMFGTDEQKQKYLTRIANGDLTAFALTEPEAGSDPAQMSTTAVLSRDGRHYVLNGTKLWTTNGPISQLMVVMARTSSTTVRGKERPQITAFIVENDTRGVEVTHRCDFMGLRAIHNGVMTFSNVKVPVENVLWGEGLGLKLALRTLNTGRLTLPAACTGLGKQCLSFVRRWGNQRVQWGRAVGEHEVGREKIASIAANTLAMEAVTWLTSHWAQTNADIRVEAAMAKLFCSEVSWRMVDQTMQFRGGRGYERATSLRARGEEAYPVERMMRDCRINLIIEGTSEIMRLFLAREALDPHLQMGSDLLRRGAPLPRKARAALRMAVFYSHWLPRQMLGRVLPARHSKYGKLAGQMRYVDRTGHRLATGLFLAMAKHGPKLERRQVLLGHLMDIGTELFAMAATCAYAVHLAEKQTGVGDPIRLAELFCLSGRERIARSFRDMGSRQPAAANPLARTVLDGDYRWLEEGVVPIGSEVQ